MVTSSRREMEREEAGGPEGRFGKYVQCVL